MKSGIYLIKNTINNKVYVGSAVNIDTRWRSHKHLLKKGKHHSCHLQSAWDKYGEQSFKFDIIEEVTNPEHLIAYEQVYLDYYKSYETDRGYNICKVAGSQLGMKHNEETKRKMSDAASGEKNPFSGRKHTEETRKKIREANKDHIVSEETRKKISQSNKGRKHSEEAREKISQAAKGRMVSEQTRKKLSEAHKNISEETRSKMSKAQKGRMVSEETRQKMSEAKKNISEETRQKISEANKGRMVSEETRKKISESKKNISEETRSKMREAWLRRRKLTENQ